MSELDQVVRARRSTRLFHSGRPVQRADVLEALDLARRAPSNSNSQPWHLVFASGPALDRLVAALVNASRDREPAIPPLPAEFENAKFALGEQLYGSMGIARDDVDSRRRAVAFNWRFYNAPLAGIVCMNRELHHVDSLGVGMFLQTLLLGLTARGLGTCVQMLIAGYPDVVREELAIPDRYEILCGLAIGYPVEEFPSNNLDVPRKPLDECVVFIDH
ncbi:nitroreductase [Mycobacterium sp. SA01]|uniref:nitroreductase n=1 Tax=Mycobacterium sp. SA01 TaxID=3238820 RepID=UPI00351AD9B5